MKYPQQFGRLMLLVFCFNLGAQIPPANKDEGSLKIGTILDLSSNIRQLTEPLQKGIEFVFEKINQKGGVKGKLLSLIPLDDKFEPSLARACVMEFINNYKIDTLLSPVGSPTLLAYLDLVKDGKILVLFPTANDTQFRKPELKYLLHCRASNAQESYAMAQYALKNIRARKIAIFYQDDIQSVDGAEEYFKKNKFMDYLLVSYERKSTNFEKHVKKIIEFNPDALFLMCIPSAGFELLRQIGVEKLFNKSLFCWSSLASETFQHDLQNRGLKAINISVFPNLKGDAPIAKEFIKIMAEHNALPDPQYYEGFINATIFGEVLNRIDGSITKDSIVAAAEKIKDVDIGGLVLNFDAQTRTLFSKIWIVTSTGEWIEFKPE